MVKSWRARGRDTRDFAQAGRSFMQTAERGLQSFWIRSQNRKCKIYFFGLGLWGYCNPSEYSHKIGNAKYMLDIMQIRKCKTKVAQNITVLILLRLFFATDGNFNLDHHFFRMQIFQMKWKRGQFSLEQMKKKEKVKVKLKVRYLAACSIQKKRWDIWRIFFSDFRSIFSP